MTLTQISSRGVEDTLRWILGASNTDHYTFTGPGLTGTVNDPTIYLSRGQTYIFENNSGGHPFQIQSTAGSSGSAYNTGVTNNGGGNGTEIKITVPHDAPDNLYYQCTSHPNMGGTIFITGAVADGSITSTKIADGTIVAGDLADDAVTSDKIAANPVLTGTGGVKLPVGTTGERTNTQGMLRFNSSLEVAEYYDGNNWVAIDIAPTVISLNNTSPTDTQIAAGFDLVITGTSFKSGATVKFIGADGTEHTSPTVTINSGTQITARVHTSVANSNEPYDITVTNASGLSGTLADALNVNAAPAFTTAAGTVATINDNATGTHATLAATDPEGGAVTFSGTVGGGMSLASSGAISGDPTDVSASTTVSFTATATDTGSNTSTRTFNIIVNPYPDGSSAVRAATSAAAIKTLTSTTTNGLYWIKPVGVSTAYQAFCNMNIGPGVILAARIDSGSTSYWHYSSNLWTTNTTLQLSETDGNGDALNAKLQPAVDFPANYLYVTNGAMDRWCRFDLASQTTGFHNIWAGSNTSFSVGGSTVGTHYSATNVATDHGNVFDADTSNGSPSYAINNINAEDTVDWNKNDNVSNYGSFGGDASARIGSHAWSDNGPWDSVHTLQRGLGLKGANHSSQTAGSYVESSGARYNMIYLA